MAQLHSNYSYQLVQYGKRMESLQCSGPFYSENFPFDFLFRKLSMYSYMYVKTESASVQHDCAIYCGQLSAIVCGLRHLLWLIVCNCMWFAPSIVASLGVAPSTRWASRTVFCCNFEKNWYLAFCLHIKRLPWVRSMERWLAMLQASSATVSHVSGQTNAAGIGTIRQGDSWMFHSTCL